MRMFLVLMTCSLPSATVAVTWFLPVTLPKPLTWVTCGGGKGGVQLLAKEEGWRRVRGGRVTAGQEPCSV